MSMDSTQEASIDNLEEMLRDPQHVGRRAGRAGRWARCPRRTKPGRGRHWRRGPRGQRRPQGRYQRCGARHRRGRKQQAATAAAAEQQGESVVQARDGKHVIPYRAGAGARTRDPSGADGQDLTAKLELDQAAAQQGKATKSADLSQIVDEQLLQQLREEAPDVARRMDNLIDLAKSLSEQVEAGRPAAEQAELRAANSRYRRWCPSRTPSRPIRNSPTSVPPTRLRSTTSPTSTPCCATALPGKTSRSPSGSMRQSECTKPPTARSSCPARPPRPRRAAASRSPPALRRPWRKPRPRHRVLPRFPISRRPAGRPFPGRGHVGSVGSALTDPFHDPFAG